MNRRWFLSLVAAAPFAPAYGAIAEKSVTLDPGGAIRAALLEQAIKAHAAHAIQRRDRLCVVDFAAPSTTPRLHLVDLAKGAVESFLTAHGKGSDPGHDTLAEIFSNEPGSNASSLGAYRCEGRYFGVHGLSLRMEGLEPTNANAMSRAIVLHSAHYMHASFRRQFGKPGRSFGCFVVEPHLIEHVVGKLEGGVLLYAGR
jgi:hypothetical protein